MNSMVEQIEQGNLILASLQAQSAPEAKTLGLLDALDAADLLIDPVTFQTEAIKIVSGRHPVLGAVHVIFPALGDCVLLA